MRGEEGPIYTQIDLLCRVRVQPPAPSPQSHGGLTVSSMVVWVPARLAKLLVAATPWYTPSTLCCSHAANLCLRCSRAPRVLSLVPLPTADRPRPMQADKVAEGEGRINFIMPSEEAWEALEAEMAKKNQMLMACRYCHRACTLAVFCLLLCS